MLLHRFESSAQRIQVDTRALHPSPLLGKDWQTFSIYLRFDCSDGWNCFRIGTVARFPWLQSLTEDSPQLRVENEFGQA